MAAPPTPEELQTLVRLARKAMWAGPEVHGLLQEAGIHVSPANFYASIPQVRDIAASFEYRPDQLGRGGPYACSGLFDRARIAGFLADIGRYAHEFDPPLEGDVAAPAGFFWKNPAFSFLDAMVYYCVLRAMRPERVVEVGSGFSTLVADQALRANGHGELVVVEPYPKAFLRQLPTVHRLIETPVQDIPEAELVDLVNACQVWFIDSTHTVKCGSDCLYLYLKVMPRVTAPVLCHSHDIYLPYAMPAALAIERNIFWTEQYLLLAYLLDNPKAEVVLGNAYLQQHLPDEAAALMDGRYPVGGASLWYRLNTRS
jgi:hypothetical protein